MTKEPYKPIPKHLAKNGLLRQKKPRRTGGDSLWIWGRHPVIAALENPNRVRLKLLASEKASKELSGEVQVVSRHCIDQALPEGAVHQGMALLTRPLPEVFIEDICTASQFNEKTLVVILDRVTDPHNIGAVLRSTAAFNASAVVLSYRHNPVVATGIIAKSSAGALERVPLIYVQKLVRALEMLKDHGFLCIGLDGHAKTSFNDIEMANRIALVLGSEGRGLNVPVRNICNILAHIGISQKVESLNLSNAATIALYEVSRR